MFDKLSLRAFVIITGWAGLLCLIGYVAYRDASVVMDKFDALIGSALTILSIAVGKWLFGGGGE